LGALVQLDGQSTFIYLIKEIIVALFSFLFNRKNQIDEKLEKINLLRVSMQQNEAVIQTRNLISELI
jgi:hypothetical protein